MRKPQYKYGIELECFMPKGKYVEFTNKVRTEIDYIVSSDPSIVLPNYNDYSKMEIKGKEGLTHAKAESSIKKLTALMKQYNVQVNKSCGYHLHMSNGSFLDKKKLQRIVKLWLACEDVFFATQPKPRQRNTYCMSRLRDQVEEKSSWRLRDEKQDLMRKLTGSTRYYALNLQSLYKQTKNKTIEARLHTGTTDYNDVMNWIDLMTAFYNYALSTQYSPQFVTALFHKKLTMRKVYLVMRTLGVSQEVKDFYVRKIAKREIAFMHYNTAKERSIEAIKANKEEVKWKKAQEKSHLALMKIQQEAKAKEDILQKEHAKIVAKLAELTKIQKTAREQVYKVL